MVLNKAQQEAVDFFEGSAVVIAGPGSGKTRVITERALKLITERNVSPDNLLIITFTRAAALEMQQRFRKINSSSEGLPTFGTFHGIFFKILKYAYNLSANSIVSDKTASLIIGRKADELQIEHSDRNELIQTLRGEIGRVKSGERALSDFISSVCDRLVFADIYETYEQELKRHRMLDFEDMMLMTEKLFRDYPHILKLWQEKFRFIMIDEFQDINSLQYEIVKMLVNPTNNLFIVGDDDQSIYGFRGSDPSIMLGFKKDFPAAREILLNYNYRSAKNIVDAAGNVISRNKLRFEKEILTAKENGAPIDYVEFEGKNEECRAVIAKIRAYKKQGFSFDKMAVIFRTNAGAVNLAALFTEENIPFTLKNEMPNIFNHFITKDIVAYIKLAMGERDRDTLQRIINRPVRYISRDMIPLEEVDLRRIKLLHQNKKWLWEAIDKLQYDLKRLSGLPPFAAIKYIRKSIKYEEWLTEYARERKLAVSELYEVLETLENDARGFESFEDWLQHMDKVENELLRQKDLDKNTPVEGVHLCTMHGSKGLEFEIVFIIDANEGMTPYLKAVSPEALEQERRMFYVAVTRAKQYLHVYSLKTCGGREIQISRFVREMQGIT